MTISTAEATRRSYLSIDRLGRPGTRLEPSIFLFFSASPIKGRHTRRKRGPARSSASGWAPVALHPGEAGSPAPTMPVAPQGACVVMVVEPAASDPEVAFTVTVPAVPVD